MERGGGAGTSTGDMAWVEYGLFTRGLDQRGEEALVCVTRAALARFLVESQEGGGGRFVHVEEKVVRGP